MTPQDSIKAVLEQLRKNGFEAFFHPDPATAAREILAMIPGTAIIGRAGSATCVELGLFDQLQARGNHVLDPYAPDLSDAQRATMRRDIQHTDVLLTGTNAITAAGHLVNIDGVGNRVSAQIFGPRQVVLVAGTNKITPDLPSALRRIKETACPRNSRRLGLKTPCAFGNPCPTPDGCSSPDRMCNALVILERRPRLSNIRVHLIEGTLGY